MQLKKITVKKLNNKPSNIKNSLNIAPTILKTTPPMKTAPTSVIFSESTSSTGILKIGRNKLFKKRFTEKRLREKRINSLASLKILTIAYE